MILKKEYVVDFDNGRIEHRIDVWFCYCILIYRFKKIVKKGRDE